MSSHPSEGILGSRRRVLVLFLALVATSVAWLPACGPAVIGIGLGASGGGGGGGGGGVAPVTPDLTGYGTATGFVPMLAPFEAAPIGSDLHLIRRYQIFPALPEGLQLAPDGTIRGVPLEPRQRTDYTIVGQFDGGETSTTLSLEVAFALGTHGAGKQRFGHVASYDVEGLGPVCGPADDQDGFIVAGSFSGQLRLGNETIVAVGADDIFVARFFDDGELVWLRSFGGEGVEQVTALGTDSAGAIVIGGLFNSERLRFEEDIELVLEDSPSGKFQIGDGFVTSFNCDGSTRWARGFYGDFKDQPFDLDVASMDGSIWVAGEYSQEVEIDDGKGGRTSLPDSNGVDAMVARFSANGDLAFASAFGGKSGKPDPVQRAMAIVAVGTGAFFAGDFQQEVTLDKTHATTADRALFLAELDANGIVLESQAFDGNLGSSLETPTLAAFSDGSLLLSAAINGTDFDLGSGIFDSSFGFSRYREIVLARFSSLPSADWHLVLRGDTVAGCNPSTNCPEGNGFRALDTIEIQGDRFFTIAGSFDHRIRMEPAGRWFDENERGGVHDKGTRDVVLARYQDGATAPQLLWAVTSGGTELDFASSLVHTADEDSFVVGLGFEGANAEFRESENAAPRRTLHVSSKNQDGLLIRYDLDGRFYLDTDE